MSADGQLAPRVSVLMPVYNAEAYLGEAIESILGQSFRNFEFLILDDGSTDGSAAIVEHYARADGRIRFTRGENRGVAQAGNALLAEARGAYLARMDADDVSLPDRLAKQVAHLDAHPEIAILGGGALYCDEKRRPIFNPRPPLAHEQIDAANLVGRSALVQPTVMMRTAFVRELGGYDPDYWNAEDLDLWLRAAEHGRLANLPDVVLHYRLNPHGLSGSDVTAQAALARRACEAAWARRGLPPQTMVAGYWRPTQEPASQRDFALKWGWQAWRAGNRGTARRYFFRALRLAPLSSAAWRGLIFGVLRSPRP